MKIKILFIIMLLFGVSANASQFIPEPREKPNYEDFANWLAGFRVQAISYGISDELMARVLNWQKPDGEVIRLDNKQYKSDMTLEEYLSKVIDQNKINKGRKFLRQNKALLEDVYRQSGVEPEFVVALWGLESDYGNNMGNFSVINSLATLAYEGRRREFFEKELLNALVILQQGHISMEEMQGSWAGAMGQCQFMPSSFFNYAVDYNGDGKVNIWSDREDVFASIANYLKTVGWDSTKERRTETLMHWNKSSFFVASVFKLAGEIKDEDL